jgi:hypothetical protein
MKAVYLDSFALVRASADARFAQAVIEHISTNDYTLIIGTMNMMEVYAWPKRWSEVSDFITSVPFCIAQDPERITAHEVKSYPSQIALPVAFCSSEHAFSRAELKEAIKTNLEHRIASFEKTYRSQYREILESILDNRSSFAPEEHGKYSAFQRWLFLQSNVLKLLYSDHGGFLEAEPAEGRDIDIECFKSVYIQALAIFLEYCVEKKDGKASDIGDIYQLAIVPYVDLAVLAQFTKAIGAP